MSNQPAGTTHLFTNYRNATEFYKEVGVSSYGFPTYVRWIKTRKAWANTPLAFDHVRLYAQEVTINA